MALGVVMIQSDIKGGSLHATRASLEYGRWLAVPYPTDRDRECGKVKVQANLLIADGENSERADLLRCPTSALNQIIILRSREDYVRMIEPTETIPPVSLPQSPSTDRQSTFSFGENKTGLNETETVIQPAESAPSEEAVHASTYFESEIREELIPSAHSQSLCLIFSSLSMQYGGQNICDNSATVKITQIPTPSSKWFQIATSIVPDKEMLELLSTRLRYLQRRLDDVRGIYFKNDVSGVNENYQFLLFSVEDLLMQMKRVVDALVKLNCYTAALRSGISSIPTTAFLVLMKDKTKMRDLSSFSWIDYLIHVSYRLHQKLTPMMPAWTQARLLYPLTI